MIYSCGSRHKPSLESYSGQCNGPIPWPKLQMTPTIGTILGFSNSGLHVFGYSGTFFHPNVPPMNMSNKTIPNNLTIGSK